MSLSRGVPAGRERWWWAIAIAAGALALIVRVVIAWGGTAPVFPFDEVSMLQMARMLAGEEVPAVRGAGYFPGWSLLIAPLSWLTDDPAVLYPAVLAVGVAVSMATAWPLARIASRFGLTPAQGWFAAFVVLIMPAWSVQADVALAEQLVFLLVACSALAVWRFHERPTVGRGLILAGLVSLAYFTHVRMLVFVAATAIWLLLALVNRQWAALAALAALGVGAYVAQWAGMSLNEALLGHPMNQGENTLDTLLSAPPVLTAKVLLAQVWAQIVQSFGLVVLGGIGVLVMTWRSVRRLAATPVVWLLGVILASAVLSVAAWANYDRLFVAEWLRLDAWLYGRYLNHVTGLVVLIGLALVITRVRRVYLGWTLGLQSVAIVATLLVVAPIASTWGYVTPAHMPGIMPWYALLPDTSTLGQVPTFTNDNRVWMVASIASLALPLLALIAREAVRALAVATLVLSTASGWIADGATDDFRRIEGLVPAGTLEVQAALAAAPGSTVGYDVGCRRDGHVDAVGQNYFGWWLLPTLMTTFDGAQQRAAAFSVVIACETDADGPSAGAVEAGGAAHESSIWVVDPDVAAAVKGN